MLLPLCAAASAASSLTSKGLASSLRLLEPPCFIWVVPGNSFWVRSEPQVVELCWKQRSTTNPVVDIISALKRQSSGLCLFLNTGRWNTDDSAAKLAHVLLVSCWEAKLSDGWQYFSRRKCTMVLWRHVSSMKRSAIFKCFYPFFPHKQQIIVRV